MSNLYLIKGETLTAIADKIRERAPANWENSTMTPEDISETGIDDVWWAGYNYKVLDLINKKATPISSILSIPAGYGNFVVNATVLVGLTSLSITEFCCGYTTTDGTNLIPTENAVAVKRSGGYATLPSGFSNITFKGGTDICNARLIDLIYQNFTLL